MHFYREIYDPAPSPWTNNDMGSGWWPGHGWPYAAFMDKAFYVDTQSNAPWINDGNSEGSLTTAACYGRSSVTALGSGGFRFDYGGPGGDSATCN